MAVLLVGLVQLLHHVRGHDLVKADCHDDTALGRQTA